MFSCCLSCLYILCTSLCAALSWRHISNVFKPTGKMKTVAQKRNQVAHATLDEYEDCRVHRESVLFCPLGDQIYSDKETEEKTKKRLTQNEGQNPFSRGWISWMFPPPWIYSQVFHNATLCYSCILDFNFSFEFLLPAGILWMRSFW